ncbi:serine hydrolase domain-containing protein [Saccharothrix xinjiangensis]|uniref:Serine hydrolase domain-containing protein n=1 Tax=Saccharothrix xinjiangensis TaxID=204798 RepID=A0ABV9XV23_9PSEU
MPTTDTARERVQRVLDRVVAQERVPGIVAEVQDGDGAWFGSAGLADLNTGRERGPGEYLHFGSNGKAFTAATVLRLVAEGRLSLDDTVEEWLPGVANANGNDGAALVIRQLLNHTSGLFATGLSPRTAYRYFTRSAVEEHRHDVLTTEFLLELAVSEPPAHAPGERFLYANGGYYLLGAIIEQVTGNSYADEVGRAVIEPLGLTRTHVRSAAEATYPDPHPRAYSNKFLREGVRPEDVTPENWHLMMEDPSLPPLDLTEMNSSLGWSAGNVVSTTSEMIRFYRAMSTGALLPPDLHEEAWATVSTEGANWVPGVRYGLGVWERTLANGVVLRGGGGSNPGSDSMVMCTPDGGRAIAIQTNNDGNVPIFFEILEAAFGSPASG